jgi:peptidoglycan/LPS O-acetylase OafA/YrhL
MTHSPHNDHSDKQTVYFGYLDALRCLAFLAVFYAHSGTIFAGSTVSPAFPLNIWMRFTIYGSYGVNFFFVLSGFLITYLLLREKAASGRVSIRQFYRKRVLRIWPVYFTTLLFGFFVLPHLISPETYAIFKFADPHMSWTAFWYNFFFAGDFFQGMGIGFASLAVGILWSVCVEEQFYFVWPWIVKWFSLRTLAYLTGLFISLSLLYKFLWAGDRVANYYLPWSVGMDLGFGAMLGIGYYAKRSKRIAISTVGILGGCIAVILSVIALGGRHATGPTGESALTEIFRLLKTPILDCIFVLIILFFVNKTEKLKAGKFHIARRMKDRVFAMLTHLGRISYGLYAYHAICFILTMQILFKAGILTRDVSRSVFFLTCFVAMAITIVVAELSYRFMEKKFLARKILK